MTNSLSVGASPRSTVMGERAMYAGAKKQKPLHRQGKSGESGSHEGFQRGTAVCCTMMADSTVRFRPAYVRSYRGSSKNHSRRPQQGC
jgi:hypothetical protein